MTEHSSPVPPRNGEPLEDTRTAPTHKHDYAFPDHTHEHTGWHRWSGVIAVALVVVLAALAVARIEQVARREAQHAAEQAESVRKLAEESTKQSESNCRVRDEQLRNQAASNAVGRKFFMDLADRLAADGNAAAATYIKTELARIPPIKPPPKANCDFPDVPPAAESG